MQNIAIDQFIVPTAHVLKTASRVKQTRTAIEFAYTCSAKRRFYSKLTENQNNLAKTWMHTCNV